MSANSNKARFSNWLRSQVPSREQLEEIRFVRPLAKRSELFRLTRRSVPRGIAVGLLVGIFALIPGIQIIGAALMCVPFRGNIPLAAGATFLSNPATTPFIIAASLYVGSALGYHADIASFTALYQHGAGIGEWTHWLVSDAAPALLIGLAIISIVSAAIGYLLSAFIWRNLVARRRKQRLAGSGQAADPASDVGDLSPAE